MNIIEQAARRLEELRRSGIEVPSPIAKPLKEVAPIRQAGEPNLPGPGVADATVPANESLRIVDRTPQREEWQRRSKGVGESRGVSIDLARLASMGYLTPETPRAQIADEFRVIKRPLVANVYGKSSPAVKRANLIMVTSALPGEGKTFVSVNLAISLAMEFEKTVLLVDADVSRPSVLKRLGLPSSPGLLDILTDASLGVADVLLRTNIEKLTLLPSGKANGRATELLASDTMDRLLEELSTRYPDRIVIFDAPPLLPSTESRALATYMGQVVVVVEADRTPHRSLTQAMATIESCPVVLPLLNKVSQSEVGAYYGYYAPV